MIGLTFASATGNPARAAPPDAAQGSAQTAATRFVQAAFKDIPGWQADNHAAAFGAFRLSCRRLLDTTPNSEAGTAKANAASPFLEICRQAMARGDRRIGRAEARGLFEHFFRPHRVIHSVPQGLLTGYYEPLLEGSRVATARFRVPLYRRPVDLENVVAESQRGAPGIGFTHMRRTQQGLVPYATRAEIDAGALAGKGLELVWLADPVDAFFVQIQGSGLVRFAGGGTMRITYDGKNGHPYGSVGRLLIDRGVIGAEAMTLQRLGDHLRADEKRGREIMQHNASYVFFRELSPAEATTAHGALDIPLTAGRSLAVDASVHALGTPIYIDAPRLRHAVAGIPFRRLMIAQDVGSAIRGPERGDIYFGSGHRAGALAGITKHPGQFYVLLPRALSVAQP